MVRVRAEERNRSRAQIQLAAAGGGDGGALVALRRDGAAASRGGVCPWPAHWATVGESSGQIPN